MTKWRAIKSVPKDRTLFLAVCHKQVEICYYSGNDCMTNDGIYIEPDNVKHWMPLPLPPKDMP